MSKSLENMCYLLSLNFGKANEKCQRKDTSTNCTIIVLDSKIYPYAHAHLITQEILIN
jgi:hypothetical protein